MLMISQCLKKQINGDVSEILRDVTVGKQFTSGKRSVKNKKKEKKMKFERSHEEECYIQYPEDVKKIREYLEKIGTLEATDAEIDDYWSQYSDEKFCAGWMVVVNEDMLDMFADWLESQLLKKSNSDNKSVENTSPVVAMILRCGDEYEYWTDFSLTDQENQQIEAILQNHANEGYSVTSDAYDIADEVKETLR